MAQRNVVWTKTAEIQFVGVLKYWASRNKSNLYPKKLIELVSTRTKQISRRPTSCELTDFPETRVCLIGVFNLFYRVVNNQIVVTAFWDNRQDPNELLKILQQ